jgi:ATP-binding cassette subfamily B protein
LLAVVVNSVAGSLRVSWTGRLGQGLMEQLRVRVFSHIQRLSLDFFTEERTGRVMTRMTSDIEVLTELLQDGIVNLVVQGLTLAVVVVVLFGLDVELAVVVVTTVVPAMLALTLWFRVASRRAYTTVRERVADVMGDLQESLAGIRVAVAFNRQRHDEAAHRNTVGEYRSASEGAAEVAAVYAPATDAVGILGQALILLVGGWMLLRGGLTLGQLTAFLLYLSSFFGPIQHLVHLYDTYQAGQAAVAKLRDLLATQPGVVERAGAPELPPVRGEITLEEVTFAYDPGEPVLREVSLTVSPGETLALVGPTGAGKSTIAKLVARFYDPQKGRVLVDGHDVRDVALSSLRRQLVVVPQEPFIFAGSIRDNIAFSRPEATDEEVMEAAVAVGLDELLARLPDGLEAPVFERGSSLSSGERQLLALARAFLAQPRVLVLDEATSSLDLRSEALIERALDNLLSGRTAVLIAHRLSTAMRAERIAVVDGGRVVEVGSHDELVARDGRYAAMYATWTASSHSPAA